MSIRTLWFCAPVLVLIACSNETDSAPFNSTGASQPPVMPGTDVSETPPNNAPADVPGAPPMQMPTSDAPAMEGMEPMGEPMAGSGGSGSMEPPAAGAAGEQMPEMTPEQDGPLLPIIPPIDGECPTFTTGTKTIKGLGGISFQVGDKVEGTPTGGLVFYWHGTGSSAAEGRRFPGTQELMSNGGIFVAFSRSTGTGGDCSGTNTFTHDDFKIADHIVACAVRDHNIDPRRIYATGCSAGGLFSGCMAIERSSYLAATVPNSGGITIGYGAIQDPTRVPAVMTMHGGPGDWVIVTFSETSQAYASYMLRLGSPIVINCDHGGGHCGAPGALYDSAWEFMKAHPFGTNSSPYADGLPAGFHSSCEIWTDTSQTPLGGEPSEVKTPATGMEWVPPME